MISDKIKEKETLQKWIINFFSCKEKDCEGCKEDANAIIQEVSSQIFDDILSDDDIKTIKDYDDCVLTLEDFIELKKKWCKDK